MKSYNEMVAEVLEVHPGAAVKYHHEVDSFALYAIDGRRLTGLHGWRSEAWIEAWQIIEFSKVDAEAVGAPGYGALK